MKRVKPVVRLYWGMSALLLLLAAQSLAQFPAPPSGIRAIDLVPESRSLPVSHGLWQLNLGRPFFVHKVFVQVSSTTAGDSQAEVIVNGDRVGIVYAPREDPFFEFRVERETDRVFLRALAVQHSRGLLQVHSVTAWVSESDNSAIQGGIMAPGMPLPPGATPRGTVPCRKCMDMGANFPTYYPSVMANVSNRAIILCDRLNFQGYANYDQLGKYILPIKKAAAKSRAMANSWGDASLTARPDYEHLLHTLDTAETYIEDLAERNGDAYQGCLELLGLREYIRRVLY